MLAFFQRLYVVAHLCSHSSTQASIGKKDALLSDKQNEIQYLSERSVVDKLTIAALRFENSGLSRVLKVQH